MYHAVLKSQSNDYIISPTQLENDLKYLQNNGYKTITMTQLINFASGKGKLPKKPIIMTFDDGFYNNFYYVYPLFAKYGEKFVLSVVGKYCDDSYRESQHPNYSYCNYEQLVEMQKSGVAEIQNHTYALHNQGRRLGARKLSTESDEQYKTMLKIDLAKLDAKLMSHGIPKPNTITYPFGALSANTRAYAKEFGFKAQLTCANGINYIGVGSDLTYLKRFIRTPELSLRKILSKFDTTHPCED